MDYYFSLSVVGRANEGKNDSSQAGRHYIWASSILVQLKF